MKKKDLAGIRSKTIAELEKLASELKLQLTKAKMEHKSKNTNVAGNLRHDLARVLSIKREKELVVSS